MNVLEERGLFWWHGDPIAPGHLTPDSYVAGLLTINEDGFIELQLDGSLSKIPMLIASANQALLKDKRIEGILKISYKFVLLDKLWTHGGRFSTGGFSYDGFSATHCLIGNTVFTIEAGENLISREMTLDLTGLEEWLRLGSIETKRTRRTLTTKYKIASDKKFSIENGTISISTKIRGPMLGKTGNGPWS